LESGRSAPSEILSEAVDLVHTFMEDCHNADVAIREMTPVDEMPLVAEEEPLDAEFGRDGFRDNTEKAGEAFFGLAVTPPIASVVVDVIKAMGRFQI
jgi:hypothetical protein